MLDPRIIFELNFSDADLVGQDLVYPENTHPKLQWYVHDPRTDQQYLVVSEVSRIAPVHQAAGPDGGKFGDGWEIDLTPMTDNLE